ncbi:MAG: HAD family hydrolase [Deltaproteobacteria bacterium]|nr:HAD family hydrolase [Deltaproteobacteria bacterium]
MQYIDLMVFDLDGTLVDSADDLTASVNHALETLGLARLSHKDILGFVGDGVTRLIERSLGEEHKILIEEAMTIFKDYYRRHLLDRTILYPGVREMLDHFSRKKKIVITNKLQDYAQVIINGLGVNDCFDAVIGMKNNNLLAKPDPRLLRPLMDKYRIMPGCTVVIGDGVNDILIAKKTGAVSCAFLGGLTDPSRLSALNPDYLYSSATELKDFFK